jgi:hypothetical protein
MENDINSSSGLKLHKFSAAGRKMKRHQSGRAAADASRILIEVQCEEYANRDGQDGQDKEKATSLLVS